MTLNISIPENIENFQPKISVIGVGGAGCNAVNTMINSSVSNIDFLVANTDGQALSRSLTKKQIQLGKNLTSGLGAGADHLIGEQAALETIDEVMSELGDINMLFIATGMGGGTGTGAAPIIAKAAKEKGILTIAVVTKPFDFEGKKRMETAEEGLKKLEDSVDTIIVIPNQNLFRIANEKTTFAEAFKLADDVLYQGISGITDLITSPGMINLDFSDIKSVMKNMGKAMMGSGEYSGDDRAKNAAELALNNPLLDNTSIKGASAILLNIKGGPDMALFEVDEAASLIRSQVDENANIIFGTSIDETLEGVLKVSVVATGISQSLSRSINSETKEIENENVNAIQKEDKEEDIKMSVTEQIDIETKIADMEVKENETELLEKNNDTNSESMEFLENKKKELSDLINNNPENNNKSFNEESHFLKKITNLFNSKKEIENIDSKKIDPSIYSLNEKDISLNKENVMNERTATPLVELDKELTKSEEEEKQIDLLNMQPEEENKLDENVLEIPAFLRRQAN